MQDENAISFTGVRNKEVKSRYLWKKTRSLDADEAGMQRTQRAISDSVMNLILWRVRTQR